MKPVRRQLLLVFLLLAVSAVGCSWLFRLLNPEWVAYRQAQVELGRGHLELATRLLEQAIALGMKSSKAQKELGYAILEQEDLVKALPIFEKLANEPDADLGVIQTLAGLYHANSRLEEAIDLYRHLPSGVELNPSAKLHLANLLRQSKRYPEAASLYEELRSDPKLGDQATIKLAEMLAWEGEYERSIQLFQAVLARHPADREVRFALARVLGWKGDLTASIELYETTLKLPIP